MADDKPGDSLKSLFHRRHMEDLEHVQKKAFTRWINKWLEKVGDGVENLYVDLQDGTKLLTLLNLLTGVKLPCEKGKTIFHKKQNIRTVLNYITEEKSIRTDGIIVEDVVDGKSKLTLALVWVLVRSFEGVQNRRELLDWAQSVTKEYDGVCVSDFTLSWKDGRAMCAIINKHRPDLLDYKDCDANQPLYNLEMAFTVAERELGIIRLLDPEDVCVPHPPEKVITMYVSELRKSFPEVPLQLPDISPPIPPVSSEAYTSSFKALCEWISSKQNLVNRNLPTTTEERQKLLETLKYIRDNEVKTKRKEKEELAVTEQKLISFQQKYKQTFALPQFIELEEVWSQFLQSLDSHVTALEKQQQTEADKKEQEKQVVRGHQRVNDKKQEELRQKIQSEFDLCRCSSPFRMTQVDGYKYKFGDSEIHRMVRTLESGTIMIRVGGGWETLEAFLLKYDPCRKSNVKMHHCQRKNTSTRSLSATDGYQESTLSLRKENDSRPKLNTKTEENNSVCNPRPRKITKQHAHGTYQHTRHKRNEEVSKLLKIFQASHSNIQSNETLLTRSQGSKIPIPTRLKV